MGRWRTHTEHWLSSEQREQDDAAEAAFAELFAALPSVAPSADFVQRATHAAWLARARRRRVMTIASVAATLLLVVLSGAIAYGVFGVTVGWLLTTALGVVTSSAVALIVAATTAFQWWSATALAGNTMAGMIATPQSAVALMSVELIGIAALFTLRRLLRAEVRFGGSRPLCF
jgi:hypothetical protein